MISYRLTWKSQITACPSWHEVSHVTHSMSVQWWVSLIYCKPTYFRDWFNFANSWILRASRKLNGTKILFLYYLHIKYSILVTLKPLQVLVQKYSTRKIWHSRKYIPLQYPMLRQIHTTNKQTKMCLKLHVTVFLNCRL